jgi:ATP-dependent RNA helicase DeaD
MKFRELNLSGKTLKAISEAGYTSPTEVQEKAIPRIIAGENLIVRSQTGTGKTAAFGIGIIERIASLNASKALILTPTRELAMQVADELSQLGRRHGLRVCVAYGGQNIRLQIRNLQRGYEMLVATPGRLLDLASRREVNLRKFNAVVLDEADHMLDLGFQKDVFDILSSTPKNKQVLLFSATVDKKIMQIVRHHMHEPKTIEVGKMEAVSTIEEERIELPKEEKMAKLAEILRAHPGAKALIFLRTKMGVMRTKTKLERRGFEWVGMLQGNMEQSQRSKVISRFKDNTLSILVATNVAARGLHVENVDLIINFDEAENKETHLHRIGRTGRMGAGGKVITFVSDDAPPPRRPPPYAGRRGRQGRNDPNKSKSYSERRTESRPKRGKGGKPKGRKSSASRGKRRNPKWNGRTRKSRR